MYQSNLEANPFNTMTHIKTEIVTINVDHLGLFSFILKGYLFLGLMNNIIMY